MSKRKGKKRVVERRAVIDERAREMMMATLIRNENAFLAVRETLKPENFEAFEVGYAVTWKLVCQLYEDCGELPDDEMLLSELQNAIAADPHLMDETEMDMLSTFIEWAFNPESFKKDLTTWNAYTRWAVKVTKQFLEERLIAQTKEVVQSVDTVPIDIPGLMASARDKAEEIASLDVSDEEELFPIDWTHTQKLEITSTGIPYLDSFLGGGHVPGEVYGILGPYGSCKTTIAVMLAAEAAKKSVHIAVSEEKPLPLIFIVSYEERMTGVRGRLLGYAAKIIRASIENMKPDMSNLSRQKNMRDYERRLFHDDLQAGKKIMGELGRAKRAVEYLNQYIVPLDMTGFGKSRGRGAGYVPEIARLISSSLRKRQQRWDRKVCCGPVVIDYVGAMVKRHMSAHEIDMSEMRHYIHNSVLRSKSEIADVYDCPVWLMHQFSGDANSRAEAARMHHTDAAEAKNFAENLDFAFCMGIPNTDNMCTISSTKHRRRPQQENMVLRIDGGLFRAVSMDGRFVVDTRRKKIISIDELGRLPGAPIPLREGTRDNPVDLGS